MEMSPQGGDATAATSRLRAVEYVRMSTEHQQYSTQNQTLKIRDYAAQRGFDVVRTYADEGKSGLRIAGREALQRLLQDVQSGAADFSVILVYDVSRWGRFQDADESAYYEYVCRRAGIRVAYCGEQFENDGSPISTIVKSVKRAMAAEYSRELSVKVFAGQCRLVELGFRQGGPAGFGLRRLLQDQAGNPKGILQRGEKKSLETDRIILIPGPAEEVAMVQQVYRWYVEDGLPRTEIAARLNAACCVLESGNPWTCSIVLDLLTNEKYTGTNVYNRVSFKLHKIRVNNPDEMWVRKENAFEAIVPRELFDAAQAEMVLRARRFTDEELIERLRALYQAKGELSGLIISEADGLPAPSVYASRFGSLLRAYQLVGFRPERDWRYLEINRLLRQMHPRIVADTMEQMGLLGGQVRRNLQTDILDVNGEFSVSLVLARCREPDEGRRHWKIRFDASLSPDLTVAVRLAPGNATPLDYYLLPRLDFSQSRLRLLETNAIELERYRFDNLDFLYQMAAQTRLRSAA